MRERFCWIMTGVLLLALPELLLAQSKSIRVINKSRSAQEINKNYPYDIPLKDLQGDSLNSEHVLLNGDCPVVLAFWLTTCPPCRIEMKNIAPHYENWVKETGVRILFISTDFEHNAEKIRTFIEDKGYPFEVYHDMHREFRQILPGGLNGLPQTFLINPKGEILYHKRKYNSGDEFALYEAMKKSVENINNK